ncbi:Os08g0216600 [Oryza sativa Japonica Group]|uniref:Os08g0213400 protein n=1 Tax=Oryza sativa subsp. japonica TaxID=39947 RepID=B7EAV6_ORYSJ|nr:hypothetical protein EE612_042785 [Oryza sativa]BAG89503.1 unnamed protein product [Oryza sativa Japonica Group]BAT04335.1 Os08g0213400 [Oryza sativa Japonica Group]BAT04352.1 Os08g0216600 [Oryza sativa Japonica Group]
MVCYVTFMGGVILGRSILLSHRAICYRTISCGWKKNKKDQNLGSQTRITFLKSAIPF